MTARASSGFSLFTHVLGDLVTFSFMFQPNKAKGGTSIANVSVCGRWEVLSRMSYVLLQQLSVGIGIFPFEISLNISGYEGDCASERCRMKQVSCGVKILQTRRTSLPYCTISSCIKYISLLDFVRFTSLWLNHKIVIMYRKERIFMSAIFFTYYLYFLKCQVVVHILYFFIFHLRSIVVHDMISRTRGRCQSIYIGC